MISAITISCCLFLSAAALAAAPAFEQPHEEDLRLLQLDLDGEVLTEDLVAYQHEGGTLLLPLGQLTRALGLAIDVQPAQGIAQGFVVHERRTFYLDANRHEITIEGKVATFDASLVRVQEEDIYADSSLLAQWLQIAFDIDLFALRMVARPREPLPMQMQRARALRMGGLHGAQRADPGFPRIRDPYRMFGTPFIDQSLRLGYRSHAAEVSYATYATADLLGMESAWYLSGNRGEQVQDFRVTLGRKDPEGGLLGFLNAREFAAGFVSQPGTTLVSHSRIPYPGAIVSNYPLEHPTQFSSNSFYGDLPPGWDAELYQNNSLIGFQRARPDGTYSFEDVPLLFGYNYFQLIFYGPQGQRRVVNHRYIVGSSLTPPGSVYYRAVVNRERGWVGTSSEGRTNGYRALAQMDVGILKQLSAAAEVSTLPLLDGVHTYGKAGLRTYLKFLFAYADVVHDRRGGSASEVGFQTRILGVGMTGSHSTLSNGFVSEVFPLLSDQISRRDRLRLDTAIPARFTPRIPITFEANRDQFLSGDVRLSLSNRISTYYRGFAGSNELRWDQMRGTESSFSGILQLSRTVRSNSVRGGITYQLDGRQRLTTVNVSADGFLTPRYRYDAGIERTIFTKSELITLGVSKLIGGYAAGAHVQYNTLGTFSASLDLSVGLGINPRTDRLVPDARPVATFGAASVRTFLDANLNGTFDAGEEPVPNVQFTIDGNPAQTVTDEQGIALLTHLIAYHPIDLALKTGSLADPAWVAQLKGVRFTPRPGRTIEADFPIALTGEIDGTVRSTRGGKTMNAGDVRLQLVDKLGRVLKETRSAYDGYYLFSEVLPAEYELRIAPADVSRFALTNPPHRTLRVEAEGTVINGIDLTFQLPREIELSAATHVDVPAPPPENPPVAVMPVRIEPAALTPVHSPSTSTYQAMWALQVGAYRIRRNAEEWDSHGSDPPASHYMAAQGDLYLVLVGPFATRKEAARERQRLLRDGVSSFIVPALPPLDSALTPTPAMKRASNGYRVQVGAFRLPENVRATVNALAKLGYKASVSRDHALEVVSIGPYVTRRLAEDVARALRQHGLESAVAPSAR